MYSFPDLEPVCWSMSSSNCCFLTCIQVGTLSVLLSTAFPVDEWMHVFIHSLGHEKFRWKTDLLIQNMPLPLRMKVIKHEYKASWLPVYFLCGHISWQLRIPVGLSTSGTTHIFFEIAGVWVNVYSFPWIYHPLPIALPSQDSSSSHLY